MPIYTYKCAKCMNEFERIVQMEDDEDKLCPKCNGYSYKTPSIPAKRRDMTVVNEGR